jgi:hypothetical protein
MPASKVEAMSVIAVGFVGWLQTYAEKGLDLPIEDTPNDELLCVFLRGEFLEVDELVTSLTVSGTYSDFVLSIEVPNELANENTVELGVGQIRDSKTGEVTGVIGALATPANRELWLTSEQANTYLDTLKIFDFEQREEVPPDSVGK